MAIVGNVFHINLFSFLLYCVTRIWLILGCEWYEYKMRLILKTLLEAGISMKYCYKIYKQNFLGSRYTGWIFYFFVLYK